MKFRRNAFSILELLAVVVIFAILAAAIIPRVITSVGDTRGNVNEHNKRMINSAVERYTAETGDQPNTIADLDTPNYFPDGIPKNPVNGANYTLHPTTKRVQDGGGGGK